jgi:GAF domain-containing protein/HAMP domain-containing protein
MSQYTKKTTLNPSDDRRYSQNGFIIIVVLMIMAVPSAALSAYVGFTNNLPRLYIISAVMVASIIFDFLLLSLIRRGRSYQAMILITLVFLVNVFTVLAIVQGLGVIAAISIILVVLSIASLAMPPIHFRLGIFTGILFAIFALLLDSMLGENRLNAPLLETVTPYIVLAIAFPIFIIMVREFGKFSLQIKVALGILITGGFTVATLTLFGLDRANSIVNTLAQKFENSVTNQTETQILMGVQTEADKINAVFLELQSDLHNVAKYRIQLEAQAALFSDGAYWNSSERVFQLFNGQYGNSASDIASIYIPNTYSVNETMLADLNTTAHLDFLAPGFLETHPEAVALYYISSLGYTTYYPNINLAQNVPPDFNPTTQPFFTIAAPRDNPERLPRWTVPYQDPAGAGLIVTLSIPVYSNRGAFKGVISADVQLTQIAEAISNMQFGESGFSFVVDQDGLILTMPEQGYALFGLQPEEIPMNESPTQTISDKGPDAVQAITPRILSGETGLATIQFSEVETYVAYAPLETTDYRLVVFVPASELNSQIIASREEVQSDIESTIQSAAIILVILFIGALLVSLWVGQIITSPLKRLTNTVETIAGGNLSARAEVETQDETGALARSFNSMAGRLSDTLQGLEDRITERTTELESINASNLRRAAQFESIARISRTISSTQTINELLPQIVETISDQLDFYHVGIFLLDARREYAVLVAANSEGGKRMLERSHRLRIGETGIVGFVTQTGTPRVALDVGLDAAFFNNPDLPNTHSEIALPLRLGPDIFGALDVQSTETNAFAEEDVNILSTLADQVSIAIQNARSHQQSREALIQAEAIAAQMSEQQWNQFVASKPVEGYYFDGVDAKLINASNNKQAHSLAIPLTLRGTRIGTLKLSTNEPDRTWTEDEIAMAQATAERTALAIENARLLQEAQKRAAKERTIGQISARIGSLVSLENILQTTVQELGNTLPNTDVAIQFTSGTPEQK